MDEGEKEAYETELYDFMEALKKNNKKLQTDGLDTRCAECGKFITDPLYCSGCMYYQPTAEL